MEEMYQSLPEKRYERNMNHNYIVLSSFDFFGQEEEDYTERMLLGNKISGLLPVLCRKNTGEKQYCYEINSLQSLDRLYEKQEIGYEALHKLLIGCIRIFEHLEEYLLDGSQIILYPEFIYIHMDTKEPFLVCYPRYHGDIRSSFKELMDYLLTKIDHTQERAVWLAYQVYRYTRNPNYVLSEIKELLYDAEEMKETVGHIDTYKKDSADDCRSGEASSSLWKEENQGSSYTDMEDNDVEDNDNKNKWSEHVSSRKNLIGAMLCILLAFSAAGMIFGSRLLKLIPLSQKQEVSLYGAIGMSVAAAVIFFVGIVKSWKQEKQIQELSEEPEEEIRYWEEDTRCSEETDDSRSERNNAEKERSREQHCEQHTSELVGETMLLEQESLVERFLQGNVNGEEIKVPLKHFPLILGKLAVFSDFVIPDNTVSRMHARLEQRNGQIYISDLNSTNGTIRNGDMLAMNEEVALEPGDKIRLGRVCFTYC